MSKRLEFHKHDKLVDEKKMNNRVYLVLHGKLAVMKYGLTVGWIEEGHFVGEMSYLSWSSAMNTMKESLQQLSSSTPTNDKNEQQSFTTKEMMNGNLSYQKTRSLKKFMDLLSDYSPLLSHAHSESTSTSSSLSNENNSNNPGNEGARVQADVICTEDCVLYAWNFQDLHELIHSYPSLGFVFERCLSEELNRKFSSNPSAKTPLPSSSSSSSSTPASSSALHSPALFSSSRGDSSSPSSSSSSLVSPADSSFAAVLVQASHENMLAYYKQILYGAIMDNEVNDTEREIIRQFREKYSITLEEHQQLLAEFHWTNEEYELGFKL
jgi:CRP-like cAMP-binding protein